MRTVFVLAYKLMDSKGREKTPKFLGIFNDIDKIEEVKLQTIGRLGKNISFQVYVSESPF